MSSIDDRIVQMFFDNKQFEQGVKQTTQTLNNFDKDLSKFGNNTALENLTKSVENVSSRFTWFGDLAFQAMSRINEVILSTATMITGHLYEAFHLLNSQFVEMANGLDEYEHKMQTIQRIIANSTAEYENEAEALTDVNAKLDELNDYADQTVYRFKDMTFGVGKFVTAGLTVDRANKAIMGLSNLAALGGANIEEMRRGITQIGQALNQEYFMKIDWRSVRYASLETMEFKNALLDAAIVMGTVRDMGGGMYQPLTTAGRKMSREVQSMAQLFNTGLESGWLKSKIFEQVLNDLGDETTSLGKKAFEAAKSVKTFHQMMDILHEEVGSGWAKSFELIIGEFDEAKTLWSDVTASLKEITQGMSNFRNERLREWKDAEGRTALLEGLKDVFGGFWDIYMTFWKAMDNIFPPSTGKQLAEATKSFAAFFEAVRPSEETLAKLTKAWEGLFMLFDTVVIIPFEIMVDVLGMLADAFGVNSASIKTFATNVLDALVFVSDLIRDFREFIWVAYAESEALTNIGESIKSIVQSIKGYLKPLVNDFLNMFSSIDLSGIFETMKTSLAGFTTLITDFFGSFFESAETNEISTLSDTILNAFQNSFGKVTAFFQGFLPQITGILSGGYSAITKFIYSISGIDLRPLDDMKDKMQDLAIEGSIWDRMVASIQKFVKDNEAVWAWFGRIWDGIKAKVGPVIDWFISKLKEMTVGDIGNLLFGYGASQLGSGFNKLGQTLINATQNVSGPIAQFFEVLSSPLKKLGDVIAAPIIQIGQGLKSLTSSVNAVILQSIAISIAILAASLAGLAFIPWEKLQNGLIVISVLFGELVGSFAAIHKIKMGGLFGGSAVAAQIVAISIAVGILALAFTAFDGIDWETLAIGLTGIGALMAMLWTFQKTLQTKNLGSGAFQLTLFAFAISEMVGAFEVLTMIPMEQIGAGLVGLFGSLAAIVIFSKVTDPALLSATSGALAAVAGGIFILAGAVWIIGTMDFGTVMSSMASLGLILVIISGVLQSFPIEQVPKLGGLAGSLILLAGAIAILGLMDFGQMVVGVMAIAAILTVVTGIISNFPVDAVPKLGGLAVSLLLITGAVAILGMMSFGNAMQGILAIASILLIIAGIVPLIEKTAGLALISMALGLTALVVPIALLGALDIFSVIQGLLAIAGALFIISQFQSKMGAGQLAAIGAAMIVMGIGLTSMSIPLMLLGSMSWESALQGLVAVGVMMAGLSQLPKIMGALKGAQLAAVGAALIVMGIGLTSLVIPIIALGSIDFWSLVQGIIAIGAVLGTFVILAKSMKLLNAVEIAASGAALIVMGIGLTSLAVPIAILGSLPVLNVLQGLVAIAAAIVVIGGLSKFLAKMNPIQMTTVGGAMIVMAVGLTSFVMPLFLLGTIPFDVILQGFVALAAILAALVISMNLMPDGAKILSIASGLLSLALSLSLFLVGVVVLGMMDLQTITNGLIALGGTLIALAIGLQLMPQNMPAISGQLLILAAAIGVFSAIVYALGSMGRDKIIQGLISLAAVLIMVGVAAYALPDGTKMTATGTGLIAMGAGLVAISLPLLLLANLSWEQLIIGLVGLAGVLALIGGAAYLLSGSAVILGVMGTAILGIGAGCLMAAAAVLLFWETLKIIFTDIGTFLSMAVDFGAAIVNGIVDGITGAVGLIIDGIKYVWGAIKGAWDYLWGNEGDTSKVAEEEMGKPVGKGIKKGLEGEAAKDAVEGVATLTEDIQDKLVMDSSAGESVVKPILEGASNELTHGKTKDQLLKDAAETRQNIIDMMNNGENSISSFEGNLILNQLKKYEDAINSEDAKRVEAEAKGLGDLIVNAFNGINKRFADREMAKIPPDIISSQTDTAFKNAGDSVKTGSGNLEGLMGQLPAGMLDGLKNSGIDLNSYMKGMPTEMMGNFSEGFEGMNFDMTKMFGNLESGEAGILTSIQNGKDAGNGMMSAFPEELISGLGGSIDPAKFKDIFSGAFGTEGVLGGITKGKDSAVGAVKTMGSDILDESKESFKPEKFESMGENIVEGIIDGIESKEALLKQKMAALANLTTETTEAELEIKSPSQVFYEIGEYTVQGFVNGVNDSLPLVGEVLANIPGITQEMWDAILGSRMFQGGGGLNSAKRWNEHTGRWEDELGNAIVEDAAIIDGLNYTMSNIDPVITPVVDLDEVETASHEIDMLLGKRGVVVSSPTSTAATAVDTSNKKIWAYNPNSHFLTGAAAQSTSTGAITMTNTFNIANESDARIISNKLGAIVSRAAYARGGFQLA